MRNRTLRHSRILRSSNIGYELPRNYNDFESPERLEFETDSGSENDNDNRNGNRNENENEHENENEEPIIPEVNIPEMINLANQIIRNSQYVHDNQFLNNSNNVQIRFPLIRTISDARDIIVEHENSGELNEEFIWNRIRHSNEGLSFDGQNLRQDINGERERERERQREADRNDNRTRGLRYADSQPFWMEFAGIITVTVFIIGIYKIFKNALTISSFSNYILQDTFEFIDFMKMNGNRSFKDTKNTSLICKFGKIIDTEFPNLSINNKILLTLLIFYSYTFFSSSLIIATSLFATLCLTFSIVMKWRSIGEFIVSVIDNGEECV